MHLAGGLKILVRWGYPYVERPRLQVVPTACYKASWS